MSHSRRRMLQQFRNLAGPYGTLDLEALDSHQLRITLTSEYVTLNRTDVQEVIRAFSAWLAEEPAGTTIITEGGGTVVVVDADGAPGSDVTVVESRPAHDPPHFTPGRRPF